MGLNFNSPARLTAALQNMEGKIGQGAFESPSVFSFFLPEFASPGAVQTAGLVSPEGMVLQGDNVLTILDAAWSAVKFGISKCPKASSFGAFPLPCSDVEGNTSISPAHLSFVPQSFASVDAIVDELDIMLTSGRLQTENKVVIKSLVEPFMEDGPKAVRAAQQLILSTPEYHATNLPRIQQDSPQKITGYTEKPKAEYKAVVMLMMRGGEKYFYFVSILFR